MNIQSVVKDGRRSTIVTLDSGRTVELEIQHQSYDDARIPVQRPGHMDQMWVNGPRTTSIALRDLETHYLYEGAATCNPQDNFSREKGRYIATKRLLAEVSKWGFTKEERRNIANAIIPKSRS